MAVALKPACALAAVLAVLLIPTGGAHAAGAGSCARMPAPTGNVIDVAPAQAGQLANIVQTRPRAPRSGWPTVPTPWEP